MTEQLMQVRFWVRIRKQSKAGKKIRCPFSILWQRMNEMVQRDCSEKNNRPYFEDKQYLVSKAETRKTGLIVSVMNACECSLCRQIVDAHEVMLHGIG
jgi:hypothetical protein